ncbi:MAG: hypothetical protein DMG08_18620 [Acidobacteria bacterium]|nr:MAG: hypothetical protein DMG08_18620 [Acidobacteriota bacterium]
METTHGDDNRPLTVAHQEKKNVRLKGIMTGVLPNISLPRLQTFVSLAAGILSVTGALVAITGLFKPAPGKGELVAIVQETKTEKAVPDATIEILTPQGAIVTTLTPDSFGKARCTLDEGHFRVRVSHPRFGDEVREVQVVSRQSTEVRVQLRGRALVRRLLGR